MSICVSGIQAGHESPSARECSHFNLCSQLSTCHESLVYGTFKP